MQAGPKFDIFGKMANSAHTHTHKNICLGNTPAGNKVTKRYFQSECQSHSKGPISGVCMPNKVSITYGSKIVVNVKVDNRQTDRHDKNMPPIILSFGIKTR